MKKQPFNYDGIEYFTLMEAAEIRGSTRQALYCAIKKGTLLVEKVKGCFRVTPEALLKYESELYCRMNRSKVNGEYIYDKKKGKITTALAADLLGMSRQNIYYAIRSNKLPYTKINGAIVIDIKELFKYRKPRHLPLCQVLSE